MKTNEITTEEYKLLKQYTQWLECACASQANVIVRQEKEIEYLIRVNEGLKFNMPDPYPEFTFKRKGSTASNS